MAGALPRPRAVAALLLATCAVVCGSPQTATTSISFEVTGHTSAERSTNAALQPEHAVELSGLDNIGDKLNKTTIEKSIVDPFTVASTTPTPVPTPQEPTLESLERDPTPAPPSETPVPTSSLSPASADRDATPVPKTPQPPSTETPTSTKEPSTPNPESSTSGTQDKSEIDSGSMAAHNRSGGRVGPTPSPTPSEDKWEESATPVPSNKRKNVIEFDVPSSPSGGDKRDNKETSAPPKPADPTNPVPTAPVPTTRAPTSPPAPSAQPTSRPPSGPAAPPSQPPAGPAAPPPQPTAGPAVPPAQPPAAATSTVPKPASPSTSPTASTPPALYVPRSTSVAPVPSKPATNQNQPVVADSVNTGNTPSRSGHSSSSHDNTIGQTIKSKKGSTSVNTTSSGSSSSTEASTSTSSKYSLGTASILSIVGVLVGIAVIILLFVLISRREYDDDDDDRDVLGYGGTGGFKIGDRPGRPSIVRLSPTFLMNGPEAGATGQPMEPDFSLPSPLQVMGSNRGVTSSRGYVPTRVIPEQSPAIMERSNPPRVSSIEGGPSPNPYESSEELTTVDSRSSAGWSSVMESDDDLRSMSRCTRDTTFSNITLGQEWDLRTGSGRGSYRTTPRRTGSRHTRGRKPMLEYDVDEEDDTSSMVSYDVDEVTRGTKLSSHQSSGYSSYRISAESQFSDFRSTGSRM